MQVALVIVLSGLSNTAVNALRLRLVMPVLARRFRDWTPIAATLATAAIGFLSRWAR